jgi:sugar transferase (PEP-CTERM system associated)
VQAPGTRDKQLVRLFNHYIHRGALLNALVDFLLIVAAVMGVAILNADGANPVVSLTVTHGFSLATCVLFINTATGFYQPNHSRSFTQSCARAALAALFALPLTYALFLVLPVEVVGRDAMWLAALIGVVTVTVHRVYAAHSGTQHRVRSRVAILGSGSAARVVADTLRASDPQVEVIGHVASPTEHQSEVPAEQLITVRGSLADAARKLKIDEIVVALSERRGGSMPLRELLDCKIRGIRVCDISTHFEKTLGQIRLDYVNAGWLIFGDGFNQGVFRTTVKRLFDIVSAALLLLLSLPVMCLAAMAIGIESRGPVFYRQQRVGLNGKTFDVVKFRSMVVDAEKDGHPRWATTSDDRVTRVGRFIRLLRIDELPQVFNVLKGEMSMVGPRPERPFFVEQLTQQIPYYAVRHSVKPGVTGWAQVRYRYGATVEDSHEKLQYDLYYVKNHTLFLDLLILFETVAVVLTGKGAR